MMDVIPKVTLFPFGKDRVEWECPGCGTLNTIEKAKANPDQLQCWSCVRKFEAYDSSKRLLKT